MEAARPGLDFRAAVAVQMTFRKLPIVSEPEGREGQA